MSSPIMASLQQSSATTTAVLAASASASASALLLVIASLVWRRTRTTKQQPHYPPHPEPCHWLWGNAPEFPDIRAGLHMDPKFLEWAKELDRSVFSLKIPVIGTMIVVADPEWIHHIAVKRNLNKSWTYKDLAPVVGKDSMVLMKHDEQWRHFRKAFSPGFAPAFLKGFVNVICDKLINRYLPALDQDALSETETPTNMMERAQAFTSDVIVQVAFGEDWFPEGYSYSNKNHPCREWFNQVTTLTSLVMSDPMIALFGVGVKRRRKEMVDNIEQVMNEVLDRRLASSQDDVGAKRDICSLAIDSIRRQESGSTGTLSDKDRRMVVDQLKTFYFAGHDTTATTIAWAGWLLSQHDDVLQKLRDELCQNQIFTTPDQRPTYDQLQNLPYLDAVLKEVLRLYPPAASARYTSDLNETYKGYTLGGAVLYLNVYIMHRLSQYWDRPDEFLPERFVGVYPSAYAHKYLPFSKGPRDCLGKYFAILEAKLAIAALVQRYDMTCIDTNEKLGFRQTMHPLGGAKVQLKLRV
jgi:cytochrome P450